MSERPCHNCRSWNGCSGYAYFTQSDITFCRYQMFFLLENLGTLTAGEYPREPVETGYIDIPATKITKGGAAFETPATLAAEVQWRLDRTGKDGKLLRYQVEAGYKLSYLDKDARMALNYISGWKRKLLSYPDWAKSRRYRTAGMYTKT